MCVKYLFVCSLTDCLLTQNELQFPCLISLSYNLHLFLAFIKIIVIPNSNAVTLVVSLSIQSLLTITTNDDAKQGRCGICVSLVADTGEDYRKKKKRPKPSLQNKMPWM